MSCPECGHEPLDQRIRWWLRRQPARWRRFQCRATGHPGWRPPSRPKARLTAPGPYGEWVSWPSAELYAGLFGRDDRTRCIRCGAPNPHEPKPEPGPLSIEWTGQSTVIGEAWTYHEPDLRGSGEVSDKP